jgi:hypothetical protein
LSLIDTTLLLAGVLTACAYFDKQTPDETEIRKCAAALYRRVDWQWGLGTGETARHGWKPESGFLHSPRPMATRSGRYSLLYPDDGGLGRDRPVIASSLSGRGL